jgi:hypothetical protein
VVQARGRLRLGAEAGHRVGRGQLAGEDHLHGHHPAQAELPRLEHHAHAAAGDLL